VLRRGRKNGQALLPCHCVGPLSFELLDAPSYYRNSAGSSTTRTLQKDCYFVFVTEPPPLLLLPPPLLPPMPRREATDDTLNRRNYILLSTLHAPHRRQRS
jgi:hypothetical protein